MTDLRRANTGAGEVLLHELGPRPVLHVGPDLRARVAQQVQFRSATAEMQIQMPLAEEKVKRVSVLVWF